VTLFVWFVVEKQAGRARRVGVQNPCAAREVLEHPLAATRAASAAQGFSPPDVW
jgi:hypothetical protein